MYIINPNLSEVISNRNNILMNNIDIKNKIKISVLNTDRCKMLKEKKLCFKDLKVKVSQFSMENIFIKSFESIKQAETETGINRKSISKMINGKRLSSGGYIWKKME
jgi:hypothetical protein